MILTYDSVLGIPVIKSDGININTKNNINNSTNSTTLSQPMNPMNPINSFNSNNWNMNMGGSAMLLLVAIILLFVLLFSNLGESNNINDSDSGNGSTNILTILLGGVILVVILLNGFQYFFNINLTAQLTNLFTVTPSLDITVEQTDVDEIPPVPEIEIKKQVFHIPGNNYTYDNADALCKAYGSRLATYDEIEQSYNNGAEWCSYGWSDKQLALFPTQKDTWNYLQTVKGHENDCGRAGINGGYIANENVKFGANCFGYKPKITDTELEMMQTTPLYPKTLKDIKEEKRVDYWRRKIPEILVSPFNKNVWSLL